MKSLGLCDVLYHTCFNNVSCMKANGMPRAPNIVVSRASEICNYSFHLVGGRDLYRCGQSAQNGSPEAPDCPQRGADPGLTSNCSFYFSCTGVVSQHLSANLKNKGFRNSSLFQAHRFALLFDARGTFLEQQTSKQTNRQTDKQTNKQTNNPNKQTKKQTNKQTNKQINNQNTPNQTKQTNKLTKNKETNKQPNK